MGGRSIIFLGSRILQSRFRQLRPAPDPSLNKEALSSGSDVYALPFLWTYMRYCKLYRLLQPRWHETFDRDLIHPLHIPLLPYFLTSPGARLISPERTSSFQYTNKKSLTWLFTGYVQTAMAFYRFKLGDIRVQINLSGQCQLTRNYFTYTSSSLNAFLVTRLYGRERLRFRRHFDLNGFVLREIHARISWKARYSEFPNMGIY